MLFSLLSLGLVFTSGSGLVSCKGADSTTSSVVPTQDAVARREAFSAVADGGTATLQGTIGAIEQFDNGNTNLYITDGTYGYRVKNSNKITTTLTFEVGKTYTFTGEKSDLSEIDGSAVSASEEITTEPIQVQELSVIAPTSYLENTGLAFKITDATFVSKESGKYTVSYNNSQITLECRGITLADVDAAFASATTSSKVSISTGVLSDSGGATKFYVFDASAVTIK